MCKESRSTVRFLMSGAVHEIEVNDPTMTVLEYLRTVAEKTATKEGCAEGDCGACTVGIGSFENGRVRYKAVNSCIQFVPTLDGNHLLTVEDLAAGGEMHPVQQAMVERDGSQCGFCTPGFVMSLYALSLDNAYPSIDEIENCLAGNLCRCTGYGPIIAAGMEGCRQAQQKPFDETSVTTLSALADERRALSIRADGRRFDAPRSVSQLIALLTDFPDATLVAGATDVGLWVTKRHQRLKHVIWLGAVKELVAVIDNGDHLMIGAGVTYDELLPRLAEYHPDLGELVRRIGSKQVRNQATMGGNIANGSPIGDGPPALIALGADLVLNGPSGRRRIPLESFFLAYGKQDRQRGEFVEAIELPKLRPTQRFAAYKISKRFDQDISAVCGAFMLEVEDGIVRDFRVCFGGMAATPKRAAACEASVIGQSWSAETIERAVDALATDYSPLTDMRASASYRARVASNLLRKFFIETDEPTVMTRVVGPKLVEAHAHAR